MGGKGSLPTVLSLFSTTQSLTDSMVVFDPAIADRGRQQGGVEVEEESNEDERAGLEGERWF